MKVDADGIGALLASLGIVTALTLAIVALSAALAHATTCKAPELRQPPAAVLDSR